MPELEAKGSVDHDTLEAYCRIWSRWREAEDGIAKAGSLIRTPSGRPVKNPYLDIATSALRELRGLEAKLGMGGASDAPAPTAETPAPESLVTRKQLAATFAIHEMTITKWERDGMPVAQRGGRGRCSYYREADVRAWRDQRNQVVGQNGQVNVAQARANKENWQGKLAEQQYLLKQGDLVPQVEVMKIWAAEIAAVRRIILQSYITSTDRVFRAATIEGRAGVERELRGIADLALRELADTDRDLEKDGPIEVPQ